MIAKIIITILLVCNYALCTQMELWEGQDSKKAWKTVGQRSWFAIVELPETTELSFDGLLRVAQEHWNSLLPADKKFVGPARLVAALYVPINHKIYLATNPKGPYQTYMTRHAADAPAWFSTIKPMWSNTPHPPDGYNYWHAEDVTYFLYETQGDDKGNGIEFELYPSDTMLAVWGSFTPNDNVGRQQPLCSVGTKRPISCQAVADALIINTGPIAAPQAPAPQPSSSDVDAYDDPDGGLDDETINEIVRECWTSTDNPFRRRTARFQPRQTSTACPFDPDPNQVKPTPLDIPLGPTDTIPVKITSKPTTSGEPTPACVMFSADDHGVTSGYCLCDESRTLPLMSVASPTIGTQSCAYTTLPPTPPVTVVPDIPTATTDMKKCRACIPVGINQDSCSSIQDCIVPTGSVVVEAGSSPVHVGTLTGTALYTSVSSALDKICPPVTQTKSPTTCATNSVIIKGVPYVEAGFLAQGELVVKVEASSYNITALRDAMINTAALAAQNAAMNKNCHEVHYESQSLRRRWMAPMRFFRKDTPHAERVTNTFCNTIGLSGVQYFNPYWRIAASPGASDFIDAAWSFHKGPEGDFLCDILMGAVDAFAVVAPEFAAADFELGEAVDVLCKEGLTKRTIES